MAHHGGNPLSDFNSDELRKMFESGNEDVFKKSMPSDQSKRLGDLLMQNKMPDLGATGNFPDGKLNENDEGEIMVGITSAEDRVILNFGKPVHWIGFTKEQAKQISFSLQHKAGFSMWDWMKKWLDAYEREHPEFSANSAINWMNQQPTTQS